MAENLELSNIFNKFPMIAFKNAKSVKNNLISSKFPAPWHTYPNYRPTHCMDTQDLENLTNLVALFQEDCSS